MKPTIPCLSLALLICSSFGVHAQAILTGEISVAETTARTDEPWIVNPGAVNIDPQDIFSFTITDLASFSIRQTLATPTRLSAHGLFIYREADGYQTATNPSPSVTEIIGFLPDLLTLDLTSPGAAALNEGETYLLVYASDQNDLAYAFEGTGTTLTDFLDGVAEEEVVIIVPMGPTPMQELNAVFQASSTAARLVVIDAGGVARDFGQVSIAMRNGTPTVALATAPEGGTQVVASTQSAPGMAGHVYTWAQVTGFRTNEDDGPANIGGTGVQIGADIAVGPDMVAGLSLGYSQIDADDTGFSQSGSLRFLQPYLA